MSGILDGYPERGAPEEQVRWLKAKLVRIHEETTARIASLERRQEDVERRMAAHEAKLAEQERRIDEIEQRLEAARRGEFPDIGDHDASPTRH